MKIDLLDKLDKLQLDKKKIIIILAASLVIALIDIGWLINLQIKGLKATSAKVSKLSGELKTLEKGLVLLQQNKLKPKVIRKIKKIILQGDIPVLVQDIDSIAKKYKVRIIQIKPAWNAGKGTGAAIGNFEPVFISLEISCSYHQLGSFVNELENSEKFVAVEAMNISPLANQYLQEKVSLTLKTYVKKQ